jgi:hypothetical protein
MHTMATTRRCSSQAAWLATAVLASLLCAGSAAAVDGPPAPTPVFGIRIGGDGVVLSDTISPALGLRLGIRLHERLAVVADGAVAPLLADVAHWNLLWGVRINPVLRRDRRIDLDVQVGLGRSGPLAMGRFVVDGVELEHHPIGRIEFTLLGAASSLVGVGPRFRYEVQPVFVREIGHLPDGDEVTGKLRFRGHQLMAAIAFEADGGGGIGHVSWDIGGGVAISGDGENAGAMLRGMFTWFMDSRPDRSPAPRQEATR